MNATGIAAFYGCSDETTCVAELRVPVGQFDVQPGPAGCAGAQPRPIEELPSDFGDYLSLQSLHGTGSDRRS